MFRTALIAASLVAFAAPASAAIVWTDWTAANSSGAQGTLGSGSITIDGGLHNWQVSGGTDYWRSGGNPYAAYDAVSNLPDNNDFVAPSGNGAVHVIKFSQTVIDPYIAVISLGQYSVNTTWTFDAPFTVVDNGAGAFGNGVFSVSGNTLAAGEAHGIIQFKGSFDQISFSSNNVEYWSGLTVGVEGFASAVPEPATWAMLITGFGLVGAAARRRRPVTVSA